ncbi:hypothetical protein N7462_010766 [Penicillium macrosclerotiorum]|uniref:uncharacterized protein n=1 Tax=Penicillium macrosclerotiorum TaxID=303699 RepID=UPI00254726B2|nr:uncharacterized protein N7462_010766 [Penicillium macrosclerotiorum]KAJ5669696.1 hypothetical protein N7462_010766 [Penicillium macrosclerotiorum]
MTLLTAFIAAASLPLADLASAERILGAYIFQRHGDRTAKALAPTKLTDLGYNEEYLSGSFFNDRYISSNSAYHIEGISSPVVNLAQIAASAPQDNVIQTSGQAFLQGLYPPLGSSASERLRNGSTIHLPLSGYQLIPMGDVQSGSGSEDNTWLESTSTCSKATLSSNAYYYSTSYEELQLSTSKMYQSLTSLTNNTIPASQMSYKNAYTIWDLFNVALIHNSTFPSSSILSDNWQELFVLANIHEFNLAYNSSDTIRAIAGMNLAGEVLTALNKTIAGGKTKLNIQFGAYSTFLSYFGLSGLSSMNNFTGMPDYASSMAWELVTNAPGTGIPSKSEINVRFMFHNGTSITGSTDLQAYPLFAQSAVQIPWTQFVDSTNKFAITSQQQWCQVCGNSTGICATTSDTTTSASSSKASSGGLSLADAGVIGAMVTLGVLAGLSVLLMLIFNLRLVRKSTLAAINRGSEASLTPAPVKSSS